MKTKRAVPLLSPRPGSSAAAPFRAGPARDSAVRSPGVRANRALRFVVAALAGAVSSLHADWTFDGGRLSESVGAGETPWIFNCTLAGNGVDLTLGTVVQKGDAAVLDLDAPVAGGYKIRAVKESTDLFKNRAAGFADEIVLPSTLTAVAAWSLQQCKNKITIPPDNEIATLGSGCLDSSYLTGDVVLPCLTTMNGRDNSGPFNRCTLLTSLDLGPGITGTESYGNLAKECTGLTNLVIRASEFTISAWSMQNCTAMRDWTFHCYPTLNNNWAYGVSFGKRHRIFADPRNTQWSDVIRSSAFTPWESADQASYRANFGDDAETPLGYTTAPFAAYLVAMGGGSEAGATVVVAASPAGYGDVSPSYGEQAGITEAVTFAAPQYSRDGDVLHECYGFFTSRWDEARMAWDDGAAVTGRTSFAFEPEGRETVKITWLWREAGYAVVADGLLDGCSIATNSLTPLEGYARKGSVVSLTAVGENFREWYNLPAGAVANGATITFEATAPAHLHAYYSWPWEYDPAAGTMSDRYWTIRVAASGKDLTLNSFAVAPGNRLDLDKEVLGGYAIRHLAANSEGLFKKRGADFADKIILPATLTEIGAWTLQDCKSRIAIPPDSELATLGAGCFMNSSLTGDVELPRLTTMNGGDGQGPFQGCTLLTSLDLGPGITGTESYGNLAKECTGLTNFVIRASEFTISAWSMQGCTAMRDWTFHCYPTLAGNWASGVAFGKTHRIFVKPEQTAWRETMASEAFTPWKDADRESYYANFGPGAQRPLGYTSAPFAAYLLAIRQPPTVIVVR